MTNSCSFIYLQVLDNSRNWWKVKNYKGDVGHAPYTILKPYEFKEEENTFDSVSPVFSCFDILRSPMMLLCVIRTFSCRQLLSLILSFCHILSEGESYYLISC